MTKINNTLAVRKTPEESLIDFQERVECLMAEYGLARYAELLEQGKRVRVHLYSGPNDEKFIYKFVANGGGMLKILPDSRKEDWYDAFVSFKNVSEETAKEFAQDLEGYKPSVSYPKQVVKNDLMEIVGLRKQDGEGRKDFRERIDNILRYHGFRGSEMLTENDGDFFYRFYEGLGKQMVDATFAGDEVEDDLGFDYITQDAYFKYGAGHDDDISDASLIFEEVSEEVVNKICSDLEGRVI